MTQQKLSSQDFNELRSIVSEILKDALNDNSAYSKLWSRPDTMSTAWWPWRNSDNWGEDDIGCISDPARGEQILDGSIEPTEKERRLLGEHFCRRMVENNPECEYVGIAPFATSSGTTGYAVFLQTDAYDPVLCIGIFASKEEAIAMVEKEAAISGW